MPQQIKGVFGRIGATIRGFTVGQRTVAIIGLAVLVLGIVALTSWLARPQYSPLFTGLSPSDANGVVEQLRANGVSYELTNGGSTVMVPEANVYEERLTAAAAGLPSSSTGGYSLLDEMGVTSSEFQQSVTYKRALEGELASTISALDGVSTASVRLAIPEETVFVSEKGAPTASVFIGTENGVTLTPDQVQAIVHLTSASIEGMNPNDVAVIDAGGTVLSAVGAGATGSAAQQATDYEQRVSQAVQQMLDQIVGTGNSSVVVAADVSLETAERVEETYEVPEGAPVLRDQTDTENYNGTGGTAPGVLGPDNIAVPDGGGGEGTYTSETSTRDNAINKVTEARQIPSGTIERQSVSVALSDGVTGVNVADIQALVATAAGINADRGDEVTVETVPFSTASADDAAAALEAAERQAAEERMSAIVRTAIIAAAIAIPLLIAIIVIARRARRRNEVEEEPLQLESSGLPEFMIAEPVHPAEPETEVLPIAPQSEPSPLDRRKAEIGQMAERDPEKTAAYLRGLLDEKQPV